MKPRLSQRLQFSLAYVLVVAVVLSLLQSWLLAPRPVELPMSKFLELLREDKVERVALTEREIHGKANPGVLPARSEEHTSELQSHSDLVCRLLLEKKKKI